MNRAEILSRLDELGAIERSQFAKQDALARELGGENRGWHATSWIREERGPLVRALRVLNEQREARKAEFARTAEEAGKALDGAPALLAGAPPEWGSRNTCPCIECGSLYQNTHKTWCVIGKQHGRSVNNDSSDEHHPNAAPPEQGGRCPDCDLPVALERKTRGAHVDLMLCGARFSAHYELYCKRVAVARLRNEIATAREQRDDYSSGLELERHNHEVTRGYRQHAEAQLADVKALNEAERAVLDVALRWRKSAVGHRAMADAVDALLALRSKEKTDGT